MKPRLFLFVWLIACGCGRPSLVPPVTDEGLKITDGSVVLLKAAAKGVQMYTCKESAWDGGHAEPDALLSNEAGEIIIHHYLNFDPAGPAWEAKDGSKVVGKRLDPAQAKAGTIPWLKLQAVAHEGSGTLSKVTFIQRVDTEGGVAPGGACEANARVRVPYKATYYFYGPAN